MFWKSLGIGSLINLATDVKRRRDVCLIQQQNLISLRDALNQLLASRGYTGNDFEDDSEKEELIEALDQFYVPEESNEAVTQMQTDFYSRRREFRNDLSRRLGILKDLFYSIHCLKSRVLPNGASELVLNEEGKPELIEGCESPELKILREKWEKGLRQELIDKHDAVRDQFVSKLRQELLSFLRFNRTKLDQPDVCQVLTEKIVDAKREGAKLVQEQEAELWMLEVPDDPEMIAIAKEGLEKIAKMNEEELHLEEESEDMQIILNFERELASYIFRCSQELRLKRYDSSDFLDPREGLRAREEEVIDFTNALPAHLVNCLTDLEISNEDLMD